MDLAQIVLTPFVWLLLFFYNLVSNYGIALILFAIVIKVILFPLSLKGKRSMIQMNMVSGKMQQLQKQFGKDKARYNQEVQELYAREKINPMGGCLWSMIPILVLWPLYAIIRQPLKYLMSLSVESIDTVASMLNWSTVALEHGWIKTAAAFKTSGYSQLYLSSLIGPDNLASLQAALGEVGQKLFSINFNFFGLDLASSPQVKFWEFPGGTAMGFGLFLLPVISAVMGLISSRITMRTNKLNQQAQSAQTNQTNMMMMLLSPLLSLWIGFAMPAGLCVYWITNNVLTMVQELVAGRILKKDYAAAAAAKAEQERLEKEEEKRQKQEASERRAQRIEESKQNKGKKKPAQKTPKAVEESVPKAVKDASREGMRTYARGRAYDPTRYGKDEEQPEEDERENLTPMMPTGEPDEIDEIDETDEIEETEEEAEAAEDEDEEE